MKKHEIFLKLAENETEFIEYAQSAGAKDLYLGNLGITNKQNKLFYLLDEECFYDYAALIHRYDDDHELLEKVFWALHTAYKIIEK